MCVGVGCVWKVGTNLCVCGGGGGVYREVGMDVCWWGECGSV